MVYFIVGLMVGSLYAIVQGPTTLKMPQPALSFATFSWVWFFAGGVLLAGLLLKNFTEHKLHPQLNQEEEQD